MHKAVLHIGSNIGDLKNNLKLCLSMIASTLGSVVATSKSYQTQAWGNENQNDFLNQAVIVETPLSAVELLQKCQDIERQMGRIKGQKWGPRIIDIDIIFYDELIFDSEHLTIPHPRMHDRNFVLFPLSDIVPDWKHPILSKSVDQLKTQSTDTQQILELI